jgi:hypothetical protein
MTIIKLIALNLLIVLFAAGCNQQPPPQATNPDPYANNTNTALAEASPYDEQGDYWAKDNLDLQRVGNVIQRSKSPQEFETYLNEPGGINNLDLNGDGYVDYISVDEFQDRDDYSRGLSFYTSYGPDQRQELGNVVFYRDELNYPGARVLVTGNNQIYGDNHYYETNWLDRTLAIASALFAPRTNYYRSPYYYNNYPPSYTVYEVAQPPMYVSRIERLYPQPALVYTTAPEFIQKIKIKSPNNGLHLGWLKARMVKPTQEQADFWKNNPRNWEHIRANKPGKSELPPGQAKKTDAGVKFNDEKLDRGHPNKTNNAGNPGKDHGKPQKFDQGGQGNGGGKGHQDKGQGNGKGQGKGKGKP